MKYKLFVIIVFVSTLLSAASEKKNVNKSFAVEPGQAIEINSVSGVSVKVRSWDRNEIKFDLQVKMNSTDEDYEKAYVDEFRIKEWKKGNDIIIDFVETEESVSWSFWDIFRLKFGVIVDKDIKGEIFVPNANPMKINIRYSNIQLAGMQSNLDIIGRGNEIYLNMCDSLGTIENFYGDVKIENCGGELNLHSRSSTVSVRGFKGNAAIKALYSAISVQDVSGNLSVETRSEELKIVNVGSALDVKADYSDVDIQNVNGFTSVTDRGGTIRINTAGGLLAAGPYCDIFAENISGTAADTIHIKNRSGTIQLTEAAGVVVIDDEYSDMKLEEISGDVNISSRSNSITAVGIKGNWISQSQYTDIDIRKLNANLVKIKNRSESVAVEMRQLPERIEINNEYGEVDITIADEIKGDITLDAKYGDIETDLPLRFRQESSSSFAYGIIGSSENIINIITRSGDIKLREF